MELDNNIRELLNQVKSTPDFSYVAFDSINDTNELGDNALHCVCVWGDLEAAKLLVNSGINVNQRGEYGYTPLRVAIEFGFQDIADYLSLNGADTQALKQEELFDRERHFAHLERLRKQIQKFEKAHKKECEDQN